MVAKSGKTFDLPQKVRKNSHYLAIMAVFHLVAEGGFEPPTSGL